MIMTAETTTVSNQGALSCAFETALKAVTRLRPQWSQTRCIHGDGLKPLAFKDNVALNPGLKPASGL